MIDLRFRPLTRWIGDKTATYKRRKPVFSGKYSSTLDTLERELRHLQAKNGTVEAGFRDDQIRNDGWPYSGVSRHRNRGRLQAEQMIEQYFKGKGAGVGR